MLLLLSLVITFLATSQAVYGPSSDVISATDKTFKKEVLQHNGIVIVEFYAPWCGHCKSLEPEYEKAATLLKGVVKVVAVDATESQSLASQYQVQGFPTLKVFGENKKSPVDYQGQRTADGIVSDTMKAVNSLVKSRKSGGSKKSAGGGNAGGSGSQKSSGGSKKGGGSEVVELTEANFNALVMESTDVWLVEFFAPWCGHCQKLAPEWEQAAKDLKGQVRLGAVDATVHGSIAQKYGVKGYPTIKVFRGGAKGKAVDYNGPREAEGIVQYALQTLEDSGVPPKVNQVTNPTVFSDLCEQKGRICVLLFVPHIYDSSAKQRDEYIQVFTEVSKSFRGKPLQFGWSEGGSQPALESAVEINGAYPTVALMSVDRGVFSVMRVSWSDKNVKAFINGVLSRTEKSMKLTASPSIESVSEWDGKDSKPPQEEAPLDADWNTD